MLFRYVDALGGHQYSGHSIKRAYIRVMVPPQENPAIAEAEAEGHAAPNGAAPASKNEKLDV